MNDRFWGLPEEKRGNIVNGALKHFATMGYRKASMQDIASACGISKSLLFHYFGTKKELFAFAYRYAADLLADSLRTFAYRENEDLFEMIRRSNLIRLELFKTHPYIYRFIYQTYFEEDPEVQDIVKDKMLAFIAEATPNVLKNMDLSRLKEGLAPEQAIQIVLWVSEGYLQGRLDAGDIDPDRLLSDFEQWMDILKNCMYKS
jgi:TetR/AcrR family transcriptional regulator